MIIPKNISLHNWAASLVIDFPNDNIPILAQSDDNWHAWGAALVQCTSFAQQGVISPDLSSSKIKKDWQAWAMMVYLSMLDF